MVEVQRVHYPDLDARFRIYRCDEVSVDSFAVVTDQFVVILDTLVSRDMMRTVVADLDPEMPNRQLLVVDTHGDWDHVWGNGLFAGPHAEQPAPIIGHELMEGRISTPEARAELEEKQAEDPAYATAEWIPPTVAIGGPTRIEGGDLTLHLLPTPGHKTDHLAVWIPQLRLLFAGDAAEWPFPRIDADAAVFRTSLRFMRDLAPETVLYCHAPGRIDPRVIDENIAHFDEMERRVRAGRDWPVAEVSPPEITRVDLRSMYEDFHRHNLDVMRAGLRAQ
jgi:glyoxylase-like metal-dependent hydrolase (beta-lactamase superfamily II)